MSSILDALRKSEAERRRGNGPSLLDLGAPARRHGLPAWAWALIVLLVVNGALLAWLLSRQAPLPAGTGASPAPAVSGSATTLPAAANAPIAAPAPPAATSPLPSSAVPAQAQARPAIRDEPVAGNPADDEPAVEAPRQARAVARQPARLPGYASAGASVPTLHLDLHFWSDMPAERYALINLHRVGEGDALPEGPRVVEITRDGVVLDYQGREFLLGRD